MKNLESLDSKKFQPLDEKSMQIKGGQQHTANTRDTHVGANGDCFVASDDEKQGYYDLAGWCG